MKYFRKKKTTDYSQNVVDWRSKKVLQSFQDRKSAR